MVRPLVFGNGAEHLLEPREALRGVAGLLELLLGPLVFGCDVGRHNTAAGRRSRRPAACPDDSTTDPWSGRTQSSTASGPERGASLAVSTRGPFVLRSSAPTPRRRGRAALSASRGSDKRSSLMRRRLLLMVLGVFGAVALSFIGARAENPFSNEFDTPFGVPPFDQIKLEHYMPAFEEAMKRHTAEIDAIVESADAADVREHGRGAGAERRDAHPREQRVLRPELLAHQRRDAGDRPGGRAQALEARATTS